MQDFLGDRCAIDGVRTDAPGAIPKHTAIIYPVVLPDRLELLLEADGVIVRRTVDVPRARVTQRAKAFARALARFGSEGYLAPAREIYDWMLRPLEAELTKRDIRNIVVVSDGPIRLIPLAALHDGKQFAIERFAFSTVTGMSMTSTQAPVKKKFAALLAGMSEPGPVVEKLAAAQASAILASAPDANPAQTLRTGAPLIRSARTRAVPSPDIAKDPAQLATWLKESLALPGVKQEIQELTKVMPNSSIVDQNFTLERFTKEVSSGDYRVVHIASHGVFGGSASTSYIMTYDQVLTMDRFESLLRGTQANAAPIDLLTLSACETAEGNELAPLGISGAAIKAKAQSVIGSLWPVGDEAARKLMTKFYEGLVNEHYSKAEALQRAQKEVLADKTLSHPFYWAPFALIGNWM
jgi:CHAT domain-containing protein